MPFEIVKKILTTSSKTDKDGLIVMASSHISRINPRGFMDKPHDWDEVLIDHSGNVVTRKRLRDYYMRNADKILPHLKGRDVMVVIGVGKNESILRRKFVPKMQGDRKASPYIRIEKVYGINDPSSIEFWANRRLVELHPVIGKDTDLIWVDIDPHYANDQQRRSLIAKIRAAVPRIEKLMRREFKGAKVSAWKSGRVGVHVEAELPDSVDTNSARNKLRDALKEEFKGDDDFTTGIVRKKPGVRLDVTTLKRTGSIRAPYSYTVTGDIKVPYRKK